MRKLIRLVTSLLMGLSLVLTPKTGMNVFAEDEPDVFVCANLDEYMNAAAAMVRDNSGATNQIERQNIFRLQTVRKSEFSNKRLLVRADELSETYGAVQVIQFGDQFILQYKTEGQTEAAYNALSASGTCYEVYPDVPVKLMTETFTGNPSWGITAMGLDVMRDELNSRGGNTITIAVLDSGIDLTNENFAGRLVEGKDCTGTESGLQDVKGHGTQVASVVAFGTPDFVNIMPIKVTDDKGNASAIFLKIGMEYAIANGADIINLSLGSKSSGWLDNEIKKATDKGVVVIVAAGNEGLHESDAGAYIYPATNKNTIAIGSVDTNKNRSYFSNYGSFVDFCAPGSSITCSSIGGGQVVTSGTSVAAPHAAAALADLMCVTGHMDKDTVMNVLVDNYTVDIGDPGKDELFGYGFIDLSSFDFNDVPELPTEELGTYMNIVIAPIGGRGAVRMHEEVAVTP